MGKFARTLSLPETDCSRQHFYDLIESVNPTADLVNTDVLDVLSNKITAGARLPFWRKYSVGHAALQTGATANNIELFQLPAGGVLHGLKVKHSVAFAGTGITDYKVGVGVSGSLGKFIGDFDVDSAVSSTNLRVAWAPLWDSLLPAAFSSADGAVAGSVTQANGVIGALTIEAGYQQAHVTALRDACETLGDNVRALAAACEVLADDARALRATLAALFAAAHGSESHGVATSVRLSAVATGADLSASSAGALDIWALYSVEV